MSSDQKPKECDCPKRGNYGGKYHTIACRIERGEDKGPQPDSCPFCGAGKRRIDSYEKHTYRCGTHVNRWYGPQRHHMSDRCVDRVIAQRDEAVGTVPMAAMADAMEAALEDEVGGSPRWLLLDYWVKRMRGVPGVV